MKKNLLLLILMAFSVVFTHAETCVDTETPLQKLYFDFGHSNLPTNSSDVNGNYWNNVMSNTVGATVNLVNSADAATPYVLEVTKKFTLNETSPGGLEAPEASLLGDFAIATATRDYFFVEGAVANVGGIKIKNLDKGKGYKFYLFGTRNTTETRTTVYDLYGLNSTTATHQTSGTGIGAGGYNGNNDKIYVSELIFPDSNGEISLDVSRPTGSTNYAYLGVMKVEEYIAPIIQATDIIISGNDITTSGETCKITAEIVPANATYPNIIWSVDNESIAWIDGNGVLHPVSDGNVTVTGKMPYEDNALTHSINVTVSNQLSNLYFAGTASEEGEGLGNAIPMKMLTGEKGSVTNMFEVYTSLSSAGTFNLYTSKDEQSTITYGAGETSGSLAINGSAITSANNGPVRITVNLNTNTYNVLPVSLALVGSAVPGGWNPGNALALPYTGNGVWAGRVTLNAGTSTDRARFVVALDNTWNYLIKKVEGTNNGLMMESVASQYGFVIEDILANLNGGVFDIVIDLRDNVYSVSCTDPNDYKISAMGSSVANGQGATNMQGYIYMYNQLLKTRFSEGIGADWTVSNISVNGNNTTNLLKRWDDDLLSDCSRYVMYGVSLGNEGIHENGQSSFDSYRDNMKLLIEKARDRGLIPVVSNNYTRTDFTATDYAYIKQMNLLIHEWDVPTINLLGAIDDGAGVWAPGYQVPGDIYHPTTEGHAEFFYAIVPSLFDALEAGKPQPMKVNSSAYKTGKSISSSKLELIPENIIHPFTLSLDIKTTNTGDIASLVEATGLGTLAIADNGKMVYHSPITGSISSENAVNDGEWYRITLSHYYALGKTILYLNNFKVGELDEKLIVQKFTLNDSGAPEKIEYRDLFFYRSAMNLEEIEALYSGKMLKSSLEIYSPLDADSGLLVNLAQSTNQLILSGGTSVDDEQIQKNSIYVIEHDVFIDCDKPQEIRMYGIDGSCIYVKQASAGQTVINNVPGGVYLIDGQKVVVY